MEFIGNDIDTTINDGLRKLNINKNDAHIIIVQKPKQYLECLKCKAIVLISDIKNNNNIYKQFAEYVNNCEYINKKINLIKHHIQIILQYCSPNINIKKTNTNKYVINIYSSHICFNNIKYLKFILNKINFLVQKCLNIYDIYVQIDINNHLANKSKNIEQIANKYIAQLQNSDQNIIQLGIMDVEDRKIVHKIVSKYHNLISKSFGDKKHRRIIIKKAF